MPFRPASSALSDLVVLDLTRVRSGPTCVRQFGDWGANVIKIDAREEGGDGPADFSARHDPDFQNLHRNKRGMALDLKNPDGIAIFKKMVANAKELFFVSFSHKKTIHFPMLCAKLS